MPVSELVPGVDRSLTIAGFPKSELRATLAPPDSPDTLPEQFTPRAALFDRRSQGWRSISVRPRYQT
ncbi:MAG: hypothetical protein WCQ77_12595 [Planctomycetota bacterium]